jgi:hypothetical protein
MPSVTYFEQQAQAAPTNLKAKQAGTSLTLG